MLWVLLALAVNAGPVIDGLDVGGLTTRQLWARSDQYFHDGDFPKSVHLLERVLLLDPTDVEAASVAAWLTWSLGDEPKAQAFLRESVRVNPNNWESHYELGFHLFDRLGLAAAGADCFRRAVACGEFPQYVPRMYAHALCYDERANEAVALWKQIAAQGQAPAAVAENNRRRALQWALRSDLFARCGGVVDGPAAADRPSVVSDTRTDDNGDGFKEHRVLLLHDPARPGQSADVRIVYQGQRIGNRIDWHWVTLSVDAEAQGNFDHALTVVDSDGDGIAESLPPIARLRTQRALALSPVLKRFAAPDRYELEVDDKGWSAPTVARQDGDRVLLSPKLMIACDSATLAVRVIARSFTTGDDTPVASLPLAAGVYATAEPDSKPVELAVNVKAPGRYGLALEILRDGVVVDRKTNPLWTVVSAAGATRLSEPLPTDRNIWREGPVAEAPGGAPRREPLPRTPAPAAKN